MAQSVRGPALSRSPESIASVGGTLATDSMMDLAGIGRLNRNQRVFPIGLYDDVFTAAQLIELQRRAGVGFSERVQDGGFAPAVGEPLGSPAILAPELEGSAADSEEREEKVKAIRETIITGLVERVAEENALAAHDRMMLEVEWQRARLETS